MNPPKLFLVLFLSFIFIAAGSVEPDAEREIAFIRHRDLRSVIQTVDTHTPPTAYKTADMRIAAKAAPAVIEINAYEEVPVYRIQYSDGPFPFIERVEHIGTARERISSGSGFFITPDGYILTNKHVVPEEDAQYTIKGTRDEEIPAEVVYRDVKNDLAILKIAGEDFPTIRLADPDDIAIGEDIVSVGNALGRFTDSVAEGEISALNQDILVETSGGREELEDLIQTDAKLYPGDSGGPLLNEKGEAVGVNVAIMVGTNVSYSIPAETVRKTIARAGISAI